MLVLLLDTSTDWVQIALLKSGKILIQKSLSFSQDLLPEIQECLERLAFKAKDLNAIFITIGPGSYTGIRMGAIVAKTLSFVYRIPLIGLNALLGWIPSKEGAFASLIDARMGGAYVLLGELQGGVSFYTDTLRLVPLEKLSFTIPKSSLFISPHAQKIKKRLENLGLSFPWKYEEKGSDLLHLAKLGQSKWEKGEWTNDGSLNLSYEKG